MQWIARITDAMKLAAVLFCGGASVGCALLHQPTPRAKPVAGPAFIGEISIVNSDAHFVLIDLGSMMPALAPGTELRVLRDENEIARVKVSAERKRPFVSADIMSGEPAPGDRVFQ